ncbi:leukocyte immunoglobulin-like receptor subfamily A member 5 [Phyllobates terribilis]|uniref:leukocyte immunoglobulin-like receptor subfamily A member 5 n=1 Tax=Phyllobates terribilis TaxID=111132 RepID=UPI003CCACF9C
MMSSNFFTTYIYMLPALQLAWGLRLEIQAFPSKVVQKGSNVTIICSSPYNQGRFSLLRNGAPLFIAENTKVNEQNFTLTNVQEHNSTDYYCYQYYDQKWRDYSDFLTLNVIDTHKPSISACAQGELEDKPVLITCSAPKPPCECKIQRFFLYSGKTQLEIWPVKTITSQKKIFKVSNFTAEYRCSYLLQVNEQPHHWIESPLSDSVTPTECEDFGIIADYTTVADYTTINRLRLALAICLIILACGFVIEYSVLPKIRIVYLHLKSEIT